MVHTLITLVYDAIVISILVYGILLWVPGGRWSPLGRRLGAVIEPMLRPFRALLGIIRIGRVGIDFAPFLLFILLAAGYFLLLWLLKVLEIR